MDKVRPIQKWLLWLSFSLAGANVGLAQTLAGSFVALDDSGVDLTLVLTTNEDGGLSGVLSGNGNALTISSWPVSDAVSVGAARSEAGTVPLVMALAEPDLRLTLFTFDVNGVPDRSTASQLLFRRSLDANSAQGGSRTESSAADVSQQSGLALPPGFTEDHPGLQPWLQHVSGKRLTQMDSYFSADSFGGGGYSSELVLILCSDRSFAFSSSSNSSLDVGGVSGNSSGTDSGQGRWTLATNGQIVGLILAFDNGQRGELALAMNEQAETYVNGTRTFVTPAEVCY
jgi:hypothetical protein